jgi:hypothetical protein
MLFGHCYCGVRCRSEALLSVAIYQPGLGILYRFIRSSKRELPLLWSFSPYLFGYPRTDHFGP